MPTITRPSGVTKCGCAYDAICTPVDAENYWVCSLHGEHEPMEQQPSLEGRTSRCAYCRAEEASSTDLPFFKYKGTEHDQHYCGCRGWE